MASSTIGKNIFSVLSAPETVYIQKARRSRSRKNKHTQVSQAQISSTQVSPKISFAGVVATKVKSEVVTEAFPNLPTSSKIRPDTPIPVSFASVAALAPKELILETKIPHSSPMVSHDPLYRTKACFHVITNGSNCEWGVCTYSGCRFVHSRSEWNDPPCTWGNNCRWINGRAGVDGCKIPDTQCKFRHPCETSAEWIKRSKTVRPSLPNTSENTHQPTKTPTKTLVKTPTKTLVKTPEVTQIPFNNQTASRTPKKSRWDEKPDQSILSFMAQKTTNQTQTIRVPTKELAEFAIKTAFDRGQYNINIVVE